MGVRESYIQAHTKNVSVVLNVNCFEDVIEWVETFREKIERDGVDIKNIKIIVNVDYFQE